MDGAGRYLRPPLPWEGHVHKRTKDLLIRANNTVSGLDEEFLSAPDNATAKEAVNNGLLYIDQSPDLTGGLRFFYCLTDYGKTAVKGTRRESFLRRLFSELWMI